MNKLPLTHESTPFEVTHDPRFVQSVEEVADPYKGVLTEASAYIHKSLAVSFSYGYNAALEDVRRGRFANGFDNGVYLAAKALYDAGHWVSGDMNHETQVHLWEDLRDAMELAKVRGIV